MGSTATPNDSKTTRTRPRHDLGTTRTRPGRDPDATRTIPNSPPIQKKCKVVTSSKNRDGTRLIYPHLPVELGTTRTEECFFVWHTDSTSMTRPPDGSLVSECAVKLVYPRLVRARSGSHTDDTPTRWKFRQRMCG